MKFSAAITLVLSAALIYGVIVSLGGNQQGLDRQPDYQDLATIIELRDQLLIDSQAAEVVEELRANLAILEQGIVLASEPTGNLLAVQPQPTMELIPQQQLQQQQPQTGIARSLSLQDVPEYLLSMVFVGPTSRFAVVDGFFRAQGERLPGGELLLNILEDRVIIQRGGEEFVVHVQ